MSEHRHKWELIIFSNETTYIIKTLCMGDDVMCKAELNSDEIERRLNATECLSAEDAHEAAGCAWEQSHKRAKLSDEYTEYGGDEGALRLHLHSEKLKKIEDNLRTYASILEPKS